jgi:hypothetical protein
VRQRPRMFLGDNRPERQDFHFEKAKHEGGNLVNF